MASLARMRENPGGGHFARIEPYMVELASALARQQPTLANELTPTRISRLGKSALLHGIGRLTLPDRILHSLVPLEPADIEVLHRHAVAGYHALQAAEDKLGSTETFLQTPNTSCTVSTSTGMAAVIPKACAASRFLCRRG